MSPLVAITVLTWVESTELPEVLVGLIQAMIWPGKHWK